MAYLAMCVSGAPDQIEKRQRLLNWQLSFTELLSGSTHFEAYKKTEPVFHSRLYLQLDENERISMTA